MVFVIDMHVHTFPASRCSRLKVPELLSKASAVGLDGVCITDHNTFNGGREALKLQEAYDIKVFLGIEVDTREGQVLIFGVKEDIPVYSPIVEILNFVHKRGGVVVAAHPFRPFIGLGELVYEVELDGIEVLNPNCTPDENFKAKIAARILKIAEIGGSDAHIKERIGTFGTSFEKEIEDEEDLVSAIKERQCKPINLLKKRR